MCLLWVLLQFVVLAMYWDVPPISSEGGSLMVELKQSDPNEEEVVPLMGADDEPAYSYKAVSCSDVKISVAHEAQQNHGNGMVWNRLRHFGASRGE